jgi:uncharacterized protein DUF2568
MRAVNDALRFLLELGALTALAVWGWSATGSPWSFALAVGAPAVAASVWGRWLAPRSQHRVGDPRRLAVELAVFGAATAALVASGHDSWAAVFGALAALHLALTFVLYQRVLAPPRPKGGQR